jgi:hypothetical protein
MGFVKIRRTKWETVLPLAGGRECPECAALVIGKHGQRDHDAWHQEIEDRFDGLSDRLPGGPVRALEGYVVDSAASLGTQPDYAEGTDGG